MNGSSPQTQRGLCRRAAALALAALFTLAPGACVTRETEKPRTIPGYSSTPRETQKKSKPAEPKPLWR